MIVVVFAGPNGSGKSTILQEERSNDDFPDYFVSPDAIAKDDSKCTVIEDHKERNINATEIAESDRSFLMGNKL